MLSAIVQQVTGQKVLDYLQPRLFEPLGIHGETWETCPRGINIGGWGLSIQTEGLAKFGQLYLQKGAWQGRQLLPAQWIEEATTFKIQQPLPGQAQPPERPERLGPRLLLPVLALHAQRFPRRWRFRAVHDRHARAGRGGGDHRRDQRHARRAGSGLGPSLAGHERTAAAQRPAVGGPIASNARLPHPGSCPRANPRRRP